MWPLANSRRLGLIGNPENRRLVDFAQAWEGLGHPSPSVFSYQQLLDDPASLSGWEVDLVRIDSAGENEQVALGLIALGAGPERAQLGFGEIAYQREYHQGFLKVLQRISQRGLPCLNAPQEIAVMFDKWSCHQRFVEQNVARPPSKLAPRTYGELRDQMGSSGRLFLKPLHGSSASGVCALRWTNNRTSLTSPLEIVEGRLFNILKVKSYHKSDEIELILGQLLAQGMIAERWIPKLSLPGGVIDLRVLVIAGVARHRVVRQSRSPMTNLHLGNRRGDEQDLASFLGVSRWSAALRLAERAAACFPRSLYVGVDILLDTLGIAYVAEVNAFGDLLPRLTHGDESAYTAIARSCQAASHTVADPLDQRALA